MHLVSKLIATTLDRKKQAAHIDQRLRFERLMHRLSATFINLPNTRIDEKITKALQLTGEFTRCDVVFQFRFGEQPEDAGMSHGGFRSGSVRDLNFNASQFDELFPWATKKLTKREAIAFGTLEARGYPE